MKDKLRSSVRGANRGEAISPEILNYSSSVITPTNDVSDKISKMMPDFGVIKNTGIIKNTESFAESKKILGNFKNALHNLSSDAFTSNTPPTVVNNTDIENGKGGLDAVVDQLDTVVSFMRKAGIEVPQAYIDFLYLVRPKTVGSPDVQIETSTPLYKIVGLDENGNVKVEVDEKLQLKRGKTSLTLPNTLKQTVDNSSTINTEFVSGMKEWLQNKVHVAGSLEKVSPGEWLDFQKNLWNRLNKQKNQESDDDVTANDTENIINEVENGFTYATASNFIQNDPITKKPFTFNVDSSAPSFHVKGGDVKIEGMSSVKEEDIKNYLGIDDKGILRRIEIPQSVNKNAYEIRLKILEDSIEFLKYQGDGKRATTDTVLDVANKFYKFVENRR